MALCIFYEVLVKKQTGPLKLLEKRTLSQQFPADPSKSLATSPHVSLDSFVIGTWDTPLVSTFAIEVLVRYTSVRYMWSLHDTVLPNRS